MAFTMTELRQELQALGYGALPDDFIVSSLSQLQIDITPQSWNIENSAEKDRSSSRRVRAEGKPSSRQVHGSPVPGDREFVATTSMKSTGRKKKDLGSTTVRKGGLDSICFTPDFATELDEMRKMLRIMQGTKEELFGSGLGSGSGASFSTQRTVRKPIGLADEHEVYVGNLWDQWRVVGRALRSKRKERCPANVGNAVPSNCNIGASSSEITGRQHDIEQHRHASTSENRSHGPKESDVSLGSVFQPPADEPSTSTGLETSENRYDLQEDHGDEGNTSDQNERLMGKAETDHHHHHQEEGLTGTGEVENNLNEMGSDALEKSGSSRVVVGVITGNDTTGPVFTRQESSSAISPGVSYKPGGMLYLENFTADACRKEQSDLLPTDEVDNLLPSHQDVAEDDNNPSLSSRRSSSGQTPKEVLDKLSALSKDQFSAAFQKSVDDLNPRDIIDQETFANVNQKILNTTLWPNCNTHVIPVESENPPELSVPASRTPDRRGGGGGRGGGHGHQSPLNDRSNMRFVEEDPEDLHCSRSAMLNKKKEWDSSVNAAFSRNSTVPLKRSRSSRGVSRRSEIVEEGNDTHLSDIAEGQQQQVDSHHLFANSTTTPPSSAVRKFKSSSEKVLRHSLSEKSEKSSISPRVTIRNRGGASDTASASDLDIPFQGLSPIKVRDQLASPLNLSNRERSCAANGYPEHRSCSVCHPLPVRKSGDSNNSESSSTTGSRSPFGSKNSETVVSDSEASPQQKRSTVTKEAAGSLLKQKLPLKKRSGAPSGIYTPLQDPPKKTDLHNSKVLLKTRRLASSMDFASDNSSLTADRRAPFLRSSTESSRSSGPQRATSSQSPGSNFKSNSGSSPYAKSASFSSFSSRSATPKDMLTSSPFEKSSSFASFGARSSATPKGTLTPGGPRRGGKVDRVARFAEMQNLWKNDKFLKTSSKRKPQSFHRIFARLHLSHERCTAAYRERVLEDMRPSTVSPPFVVPTTLSSNSEGVCIF